METFWFFWLRFSRDFWFSLSHKRSYDSAYDSDSNSVASENQPLRSKSTLDSPKSFFNAFGKKLSLGAPALINAARSWIHSIFLLSEDLQLCHTKWQYVKWGRMDDLLISFALQGVHQRFDLLLCKCYRYGWWLIASLSSLSTPSNLTCEVLIGNDLIFNLQGLSQCFLDW